MVAIGLHYFPSAPRPDGTHTPRAVFNAHAGVRGFMLFPPESVGAYADWRTQEVGVAADHSGDKRLKADYLGGDIYHALALMCGLTNDPDPIHWKKNNPDVRERMKRLQLAISYGMGVPSLARGLNRHPIIALEIIEKHKRTYPRFWEWRAEMVQTAMMERRIESIYGWPLRISSSPNKRTLYNFPKRGHSAIVQSVGICRLPESIVRMAVDGHLLPLQGARLDRLGFDRGPDRLGLDRLGLDRLGLRRLHLLLFALDVIDDVFDVLCKLHQVDRVQCLNVGNTEVVYSDATEVHQHQECAADVSPNESRFVRRWWLRRRGRL